MAEEFITKKGLEKLTKELTELKTKRRKTVSERLKEALSFGDIAENAEYAEAKEEQAFVEGRIAEIENILRSAMLVTGRHDVPKFWLGGAAIGSVVELAGAGQRRKLTLVGKGEGNPLSGEISSDSPLGQAILGRKAGDEVRVSTPTGKKNYKIIRIA